MLDVCLELTIRTVRVEDRSRAAVLDEYRVRVKTLEKKVGESKLNVMALLRELTQSKHEAERLECEYRLLRQTKKAVMDKAAR